MSNITTKFISHFINSKKNILFIGNDFWKKDAEKFLRHKEKQDFVGLFDFDILGKDWYKNFIEYFQNKDNEKYNLIVAELPFGLKKTENKDIDFLIPENWDLIYKLLQNLEDDGILIVGIEQSFGTHTKSNHFLDFLENKKFFLSALVETPQNILFPLTAHQPNIAIFTKHNNKRKIFISSLDETDNEAIIYNNFINNINRNNLSEGDIVEIKNFKGFFNYKINKEIKNLQTQYKKFEKTFLGNIAISINTTRTIFEEKSKEYLYIQKNVGSKMGNLNVFSDIEKLDKKHQNFFQIEVDESIASSKYLENYFKSDLGQLSLKSLLADTLISIIHTNELQKLVIPLPPLEIQKEIVSSYNLLNSVFDVIKTLEKDLSLNPKNAKIIIEKLTDTLHFLNQLSKSDKILLYIRQGENLTTEYKQTFSIDIKTGKKEKFIEDSSLKNIAGFLNKKGGILLVGVADNGEIYGIEKDAYQSDDKYLLHFKNRVKDAIGEEFFDLIHYEIVSVNEKKILLVECKASSKPVYMYGKDFYVRTNPSTDKLEGPKLVDYIKSHFKE
jgi:Holliday junction resolvase